MSNPAQTYRPSPNMPGGGAKHQISPSPHAEAVIHLVENAPYLREH